jgi:glycosyltransferase involved in cell wall biosynthesis
MTIKNTNRHSFSIIIPTYNRPERLYRCIESLASLDYSKSYFEVIVVDDGSSIPQKDIITYFQNKLDITLINKSHSGPGSARNAGAKVAKGSFLAFTDDDCRPAPDWLEMYALGFGDTPDCVIGGCTKNGLPHNPYATATQMLIDYLYERLPARSKFFTTNNMALSSKIFRETGGFDERFPLAGGEDREFCHRLISRGINLVHEPNARVFHYHDSNFKNFCFQHYRYGRGSCLFHLISERGSLMRPTPEPFSFYLDLIKIPHVKTSGLQMVRLSKLLFTAQVAGLIGCLIELALYHKRNPN